jgi:endogenous inhibitor of DNA gyrase (YacG/DUF329 family)
MTTAEKDGGQHEPHRSVARCPICNQPRSETYRPFCSKRCADVDLGRWLNGSYAIPVTEDDDEDGEEDRPASEKKPDDSVS